MGEPGIDPFDPSIRLGCPAYTQYVPTGLSATAPTDHAVQEIVPAFCLDRYEVINEAYDEYVWNHQYVPSFGCFVKDCDTGEPSLVDAANAPDILAQRYQSLLDGRRTCGVEVRPLIASDLRSVPEHLGGEEQPAVNVSWDEAQAYCVARGGNLPTLAQFHRAPEAAYGLTIGVSDWVVDDAPNPQAGWEESTRLTYGVRWPFASLRGHYLATYYRTQSGNEDIGFRCAFTPLVAE